MINRIMRLLKEIKQKKKEEQERINESHRKYREFQRKCYVTKLEFIQKYLGDPAASSISVNGNVYEDAYIEISVLREERGPLANFANSIYRGTLEGKHNGFYPLLKVKKADSVPVHKRFKLIISGVLGDIETLECRTSALMGQI